MAQKAFGARVQNRHAGFGNVDLLARSRESLPVSTRDDAPENPVHQAVQVSCLPYPPMGIYPKTATPSEDLAILAVEDFSTAQSTP